MSKWKQLAASQWWGSLEELLTLSFCGKLGMEQAEVEVKLCVQGVRVGNDFIVHKPGGGSSFEGTAAALHSASWPCHPTLAFPRHCSGTDRIQVPWTHLCHLWHSQRITPSCTICTGVFGTNFGY